MGLIVQKFGGTSVANIDRIKKIVDIVKTELHQSNKVIIVVSAMAGVTNHLVSLCNELSSLNSNTKRKEYDAALASGELVTASLLSLYLQEKNIKARSFAGWQLPILTNDNHSNAYVESFCTDQLLDCLKEDVIPVIAGFQGIDRDMRVSTLGRGGSDITAALAAAAVKADRCDIYTDVEGVFTADPRVVHHARKLDQISYEQMLDLASSGAKVLNPRCVEVAMRYNIPLRVLSSSSFITGTLIQSKNNIMENEIITSITSNKNLLKVDILDSSLTFNELIAYVSEYSINIEIMLNLGDSASYSFISALNDRHQIETLLNELKIKNLIRNYSLSSNIATLAVIGYGIKANNKLTGVITKKLEKAKIALKMLQVSEIKITILIDDKYAEQAVSILHELIE